MLILRYEHGTSEAEIGRLLGTSRAVVAVTLFRARARLKKLLRASYDYPPGHQYIEGAPEGWPVEDGCEDR